MPLCNTRTQKVGTGTRRVISNVNGKFIKINHHAQWQPRSIPSLNYMRMWKVERKSGALVITCSNSAKDSFPSSSTSPSSSTCENVQTSRVRVEFTYNISCHDHDHERKVLKKCVGILSGSSFCSRITKNVEWANKIFSSPNETSISNPVWKVITFTSFWFI